MHDGVLPVLKYNLSEGCRAKCIWQHYVVQAYAATMSFFSLLITVEKSQSPCEERTPLVHVNIFNMSVFIVILNSVPGSQVLFLCCTYVRLAWAPLCGRLVGKR
jgi:hypothetical protein